MRIKAVLPACSCRPVVLPATARLLSTSSATTSLQPRTHTHPTTVEQLKDLQDLLNKYPATPTYSRRIAGTLADLEQPRSARIAIIGSQECGTTGVVTAAFDEAEADGETSVALASRRLGDAPEALTLVYGDRAKLSPPVLELPSAWLRDNRTSVLEIVHGDAPPRQNSVDALFSADTVVLVSDDGSLAPPHFRSLLLELSGKPNLIVVLNTSDLSHPSSSRALSQQLESLLPPSSRPPIYVISTSLAVEALEALNPSDPTILPSIEKFQSRFVASGILGLKDVLAGSVASISERSIDADSHSALQEQTAGFVLDRSIREAAFSAAKVEDELVQAANDVAALRFRGEDGEKAALAELGIANGALRIPSEELAKSKVAVDDLFNTRLNWYTLPFRSDDIPAELSPLLHRTYLQDFENSLVFSTGQLISLSENMSEHTNTLLATSAFIAPSVRSQPLSSLYSPIYLNHLAQAAIESKRISSSDLSIELTRRRNQLTAPGGPVDILQIKSQEAVVSSVTLGASSIIVGIVMDVMQYAEMGMSVGVGLIGVVLGLRGLQKKWAKAKSRFGRDLEERVTKGLEEDLALAAQRVIDRSLYKSRSAVAGAEDMIRKRREEYLNFAKNLARIDRVRRGVMGEK